MTGDGANNPSFVETPYRSDAQPLFFPIDSRSLADFPRAEPRLDHAVRTYCRSLDGMLKEAIVVSSATGRGWRLVSDEGPYLNGLDSAPCPLAFMITGMVSGYMNSLRAIAHRRSVRLDDVALAEDNSYAMEGSALRGTMTGHAVAVQLAINPGVSSGNAALAEIAREAVAAAPVNGLVREKQPSEFSLTLNGTPIPTGQAHPARAPVPPFGYDAFRRVQLSRSGSRDCLVERLEAVKPQSGVEGGAGSSLQAEQKRKLLLRADCLRRPDGLMAIKQQMFNPMGSTFALLADAPEHLGGSGRAPDSQSYMAAGIAFCFMTQLGRYATIVRRKLDRYWLVQDIHFSAEPDGTRDAPAGRALPVETHLFLESPEDEDFARRLLDMGEQTCFLHALQGRSACTSGMPPVRQFMWLTSYHGSHYSNNSSESRAKPCAPRLESSEAAHPDFCSRTF